MENKLKLKRKAKTDNDLLTIDEVAKALKIQNKTLYARLAKDGNKKYIKKTGKGKSISILVKKIYLVEQLNAKTTDSEYQELLDLYYNVFDVIEAKIDDESVDIRTLIISKIREKDPIFAREMSVTYIAYIIKTLNFKKKYIYVELKEIFEEMLSESENEES